MTRAEDVHAVPSAAVLEQVRRWAVTDSWADRGPADYTAGAVHAASQSSTDHFRAELASVVKHDGPGSHAAVLQATLWGNADAALVALADNDGLQTLLRSAAQVDGGRDVAEIAIPNGLRLRAEQTGEAYETTVLVEDTPGRSDVLASSTITAPTATDALRAAAEREHAVHGLDQEDVRQVDQQLSRLEQLTTTQGWAEEPPQHPDAGWNPATELPAAVARTPLPAGGSVSHDLAYRVMDAVPDAVPPAPSIAQINGTQATSTGRVHEAAEQAVRPSPAPDRRSSIGR